MKTFILLKGLIKAAIFALKSSSGIRMDMWIWKKEEAYGEVACHNLDVELFGPKTQKL